MITNDKNLGQQISDRIYHKIIKGDFAPGSKLPNEIDLSKEFNVSRTTIREAIRTLSTQGILQVKRGSGTYVVPDADKFNRTAFNDFEHVKMRLKDLLEMRLIIEPECAALTCMRASDAEIDYILEQGAKVSTKINDNTDEWVMANHHFHDAIAKASHNDMMRQFIPILTQSINEVVKLMPEQDELEENTIIDHALIMEFIKARNPDGARSAMKIHTLHMIETLNLDVMK